MSVPAIIRWDQAYNRSGDENLSRTTMNALRTYMNNHTLDGWVKAETLSRDTGLSVRTVRRQISEHVSAGWVQIVRQGNSSGLSNTYRLTFPKGDTHVTVRTQKGVTGDTSRVSVVAVKGDTHVTPTTPLTTPRTSPERSSIGTTQTEKGDTHVTLAADPANGSGVYSPVNPATESKGDMGVTLDDDVTCDSVDFVAAYKRSNHVDPFREVRLWRHGDEPPAFDPFGPVYLDDVTGKPLH